MDCVFAQIPACVKLATYAERDIIKIPTFHAEFSIHPYVHDPSQPSKSLQVFVPMCHYILHVSVLVIAHAVAAALHNHELVFLFPALAPPYSKGPGALPLQLPAAYDGPLPADYVIPVSRACVRVEQY